MPDNLPASSTIAAQTAFALTDHALLALEGPDAIAFAQAQFANDVVALATGHWQWSAWLTPKGRTIAVFALLRLADDALLLLLPDGDADALGDQLRRFVFRRKAVLRARPDLAVLGRFAPPATASGASIAHDGASWELDYGAESLSRTVLICEREALHAEASADALERWAEADLACGLPRLVDAQREQWTPQQIALDRLHAFSVKKGCYPGQEIVARTHFLGKAKRELLRLQVADAVEAGAEVQQDGRAIGSVVSVAGRAPRHALAVLPLERGDGPLLVDGREAVPAPIRGGLGR